MENYSEIVGLPVVGIDHGTKIGTVEDILFCKKDRVVKALVLERKGIHLKQKVILLKDILNMGKDAVVVEDGRCLIGLSQVKKWEEFKNIGKLTGLKVYSKFGDDLGIVKDILFDYQNGAIEGVEVSDGIFQDVVSGRKVIPLFGRVEFGEENILIDREALEEISFTGGGIKKIMEGKE